MVEKIQKNIKLELNHITRIEGHGNIAVNLRDGVLERCELEVIEAPRYFEAMLHGYSYRRVPSLVSRICGICAVAHTTTSLRAVERALGIEPTPQTGILRKINFLGEMLDSHILHVYLLAAPDLVGVGSVISLAESSPEVVARALRMKQLAGKVCSLIGGRHTHPISMALGGFSKLPSESSFLDLYHRLEAIRTDIDDTVELLQSMSLPDFERETEYIALSRDDEYCFIDGNITSSDGGVWPPDQYGQITNEFMVSHSSAKHTRHERGSYMVGALARFNLNYKMLHPNAQEAAAALNLYPKCHNPYKITLAQVVEIVHSYYELLRYLKELLNMGIENEEPVQPARLSGEGVGACEAPRGTLYHHYVIRNGAIFKANCVIPTGQNLANIEADMRAALPKFLHKSESEIAQLLEMLVRAYDPCISCSTHMLEVTFV